MVSMPGAIAKNFTERLLKIVEQLRPLLRFY